MYLIPSPTRQRASPVLRDKFLNALDQHDQPVLRQIVRDLLGCVDPLPVGTCILLGLGPGSTYGDAANAITSALGANSDVPQIGSREVQGGALDGRMEARMTDDDYLEKARKEMVQIEGYTRDAALRLGIPNAIVTWGEGWPLSRAVKAYPMRVTSGEVSQTMEFLLDGLADYPGGRGNAVPEADVDKLLQAVVASLR